MVTSTPERWYMLWNLALVTYAILLVAGLSWWLGPKVIARGIQIWITSK